MTQECKTMDAILSKKVLLNKFKHNSTKLWMLLRNMNYQRVKHKNDYANSNKNQTVDS